MRPLPQGLRHRIDDAGRDLSILIVRLGAMGDVIRTVPAMRRLRDALPQAKIHWLVDHSWLPVLDGHPDLDGCITVDRKALRGSLAARRAALGDLRRRLRAVQPELALDFHGNLRSGVLTRLSAAPIRLGYAGHQQKEGNRWLTTHRLPAGSRRQSRIERNLGLLELLAIEPRLPLLTAPALPLIVRGRQSAAGCLDEAGLQPGRFVVVAPGASAAQAYKRPPERLLAAGAQIFGRHGWPALVVWGPGEEPQARAAVAAVDGARLAPPTDLPTLAALIDMAGAFIGGDSGPMHLACAAGRPVLALYGPTDPEVNCPWGGPFVRAFPPAAEYRGIKRHDRAIGFDGLSAEQVTDAAATLLLRALGRAQRTAER